MTLLVKNEISKIVDEIKSVTHPKKIILFGSYAYGSPNADSDLDLCVVLGDNTMRRVDAMKIIRKAIVAYVSLPIDLLVYYADDFSERVQLNSSLEYKIDVEGISLYEQ